LEIIISELSDFAFFARGHSPFFPSQFSIN
jgi:hypothetical protein